MAGAPGLETEGDGWMQELMKDGPAAYSFFEDAQTYGGSCTSMAAGSAGVMNRNESLGAATAAPVDANSNFMLDMARDLGLLPGGCSDGINSGVGCFGEQADVKPLQSWQANPSLQPMEMSVLPASAGTTQQLQTPQGQQQLPQQAQLQQIPQLAQQQLQCQQPPQQLQQPWQQVQGVWPSQPPLNQVLPPAVQQPMFSSLASFTQPQVQLYQQVQQQQQPVVPGSGPLGIAVPSGFAMPGLPSFSFSPPAPGHGATSSTLLQPGMDFSLLQQPDQQPALFAAPPAGRRASAEGAAPLHAPSSAGAAAAAYAATAAGAVKQHKGRGRGRTTDTAAAARQLTKSGDASRRYRCVEVIPSDCNGTATLRVVLCLWLCAPISLQLHCLEGKL